MILPALPPPRSFSGTPYVNRPASRPCRRACPCGSSPMPDRPQRSPVAVEHDPADHATAAAPTSVRSVRVSIAVAGRLPWRPWLRCLPPTGCCWTISSSVPFATAGLWPLRPGRSGGNRGSASFIIRRPCPRFPWPIIGSKTCLPCRSSDRACRTWFGRSPCRTTWPAGCGRSWTCRST